MVVATSMLSLTCMSHDAIITGHGAALPDGADVILFRSYGQMGTSVASDTMKDGKFTLTVPTDTTLFEAMLSITAKGFPSTSRKLYITPSARIDVDIPDYYARTWPVKSNVAEQIQFDRFINKSKNLIDSLLQMNIDYTNALAEITDNAARDSVKQAYNENKWLRDSLNNEIAMRDIELLRDSEVGNIWFAKAEDLVRGDLSAEALKSFNDIFNNLDVALRTSAAGTRIQSLLNPPHLLKIGDTVPEVDLYDIEGKAHHLSYFSGKWILLEFGSRGCYACMIAKPELQELSKNLADKLEVVTLSIDTEKMWREEAKDTTIIWNNWNEGNEDLGLYRQFGAKGLPTFVFISPEGKIAYSTLGYAKGSLERIFKQLSTPRKPMNISHKGDKILITSPAIDENNTSGILDITAVEISNDATTLFFTVDYNPGMWITISPKSQLITADGKHYAIKNCEGIVAGEKFYADENGKGSFNISFEPIPENTPSFDFTESSDGSRWFINGIHIK